MTRRAAIVGLSQVSAVGTGVGALEAALRDAPPAPAWERCPGEPEGRLVPLLRARAEGVEEHLEARLTRRMDPFTLDALLSATLALRAPSVPGAEPERIGLVLATGYGALPASFAFLDDVIDKGDRRGSPITFASSVHGAPASAISSTLDLRGPTLTVSGAAAPLVEALWIAIDRLYQGDVDLVLLAAADAFHQVLGARLLGRELHARDGRIRPLALEEQGVVPGEVYTTLVLARPGDVARPRWGSVEEPVPFSGADAARDLGSDPVLLSAAGRAAEGGAYLEVARAARSVAAYTPLWGTCPVGEALTLAAAAVALATGRLPPVPEAGGATRGLAVAEPGPLSRGATLRCCSVDRLRPRASVVAVHGPEAGLP